jgi:DNA modification methylase
MVITGDALQVLETLESSSVQTCVTSPPYWGLRDYGVSGQMGLEKTPDEYVANLVSVFREVRRVLRDDGTLWLNLGDSYAANGVKANRPQTNNTTVDGIRVRMARDATPSDSRANLNGAFESGLKPKDLVGIPWRVAFALQADGWYLRQDIIWHKPNPMPESVRDRCTKSHEYIFLLAKSERYFYDAEAVKEPLATASFERAKYPRVGHPKDVYGDGITNLRNPKTDAESRAREISSGLRNRRSVWTVTTKPFKGAHFATFPPDLIEPCIKAGSPEGGTVLDPFFGAGTTGLVASRLGRKYIGIELNPEYVALAELRLGTCV